MFSKLKTKRNEEIDKVVFAINETIVEAMNISIDSRRFIARAKAKVYLYTMEKKRRNVQDKANGVVKHIEATSKKLQDRLDDLEKCRDALLKLKLNYDKNMHKICLEETNTAQVNILKTINACRCAFGKVAVL